MYHCRESDLMGRTFDGHDQRPSVPVVEKKYQVTFVSGPCGQLQHDEQLHSLDYC